MKFKIRYLTLTIILFAGLSSLAWRVLTLHIWEKPFLCDQAEKRTVRIVSVPAYRGMIMDRFNEPLAISTPVDSVWLNPKEFNSEHVEVLKLASLLDISLNDILEKYQRNQQREFVYLHRHVTPQIAYQIKQLGIPGVHLRSEYRRYYPTGEITSPVLGFTDIDDKGQEGLELAFDEWLSGEKGAKKILRDRLGREVQTLQGIKEMRGGQDVVLSLDQRLQYVAYRELKAIVNKSQALSGVAIVLDVRTGEVLAMANHPSFNPNTRVKLFKEGGFKNRAVTDVFEPGSVMKSFSVASALQSGRVKPTTLIDTAPGWMKVGANIVREDKNHNFGLIDVATILKKSSNVGVSKITLALPAKQLWDTYKAFGFGELTGSGFPGESKGTLMRVSKYSPFVLATLAYGYGLNVTPLQLAEAYSILGAGGVKRPVTFLKQASYPEGERVMEQAIARQIVQMLAGVVTAGSGVKAQVQGYQIAGKTGTAQKVSPQGGYQKNSHVAVFAGLAPASDPRFAIVVMIDDPKGAEYYGSQVAAPVFSKIAQQALRLYHIPFDLKESEDFRIAQREAERSQLHE